MEQTLGLERTPDMDQSFLYFHTIHNIVNRRSVLVWYGINIEHDGFTLAPIIGIYLWYGSIPYPLHWY